MASMASTAASRHVVALPYPGCGHINPMLAVCRRLVSTDAALVVIIIVTEEWHEILSSAGVVTTLPDRVGFATVLNVIPSEHGRGDDHIGFIVAVHTDMAAAVERLLDRLVAERRPDAIIADTYLAWGVEVAARRGIPVCSLWTMAATFFWALYNLELWPPVDGRESEQELSCKSLEQYVPALSSVRLSDIKVIRAWELPMKIAVELFINVRKAHCLLFTSFHELEPDAVNRITETVPFPVYSIGPSIPHLPLSGGDPANIHDDDHRNWLDKQQENSVLYVSFGRHVSLPTSQLEELTMGLRDSGVKLFWVGRNKVESLQQQIGRDRGLVVPWCEQLKVLCHPSIGGFLSHCGWNSMLETVAAGVPLLAFPVKWDQLVDGHIVEDEWKIGINLREQRSKDGIVSRAAICAAATKLMDLNDGESQGMRRRAAGFREACLGAIQEGGSSHRSLNGFVNDLAKGLLNVKET